MRATLYHAAPPAGIPRSAAYRVRINGEEIFVYQCAVASYCLLSAEGELAVEVETLFDFSTMQIRPLSRRLAAHTDRRTIAFSVCAPAKLSIEPDGDLHNPLFLLINPRETDVPNPQEPKVRYFAGGQEYDAGEILLGEGETLYIEAGAVVYGPCGCGTCGWRTHSRKGYFVWKPHCDAGATATDGAHRAVEGDCGGRRYNCGWPKLASGSRGL